MSQYLTVAELVEGPMGVDWRSLPSQSQPTPAGVSIQQNYQKVLDIILKASGFVDVYCNQILSATLDTEEKWTGTRSCGIDNNGYLWVRPDNFPVISMQSFQYGLPALGGTSWQVATLTDLVTIGDLKGRVIYPTFLDQRGRGPYRVQYSYLNGYVTALMTAAVSAGVLSLPLSDLTGILPNQQLMIYDGGNTEKITVASSHVPVLGPGSVNLAAATVSAHTPKFLPSSPENEPYDIMVTNLPPELKLAVQMICKYIAELRGSTALIAPSGRAPSQSKTMAELPDEARSILDRYTQVF